MPTYQFLNLNTNVVEDHKMSISELDDFKAKHPHLQRHFTHEALPVFGDATRMSVPGAGQPVKAFEQGVIQRIADTVPGNTIRKYHKTKLPREF